MAEQTQQQAGSTQASGAAADTKGSAATGEQQQTQQGAASSQTGTQQQGTTDAQSTDASKATVKTDGQADVEIKLPEGVQANQEVLASFKETAKALGLKGEQQQKLVDYWLGLSAQAQKAQQEKTDKQRLADIEAIKADAEFGGVKFDQTVADAKGFVAEFGGEDASKAFVAAGLDLNPGIVKMLARARKAISEDKLVKGKIVPAAEDADAVMRKTFPKSYDAMKKISPQKTG